MGMRHRQGIKRQAGSTLIEGLIAVLIFSMGILGIVALQGNTVRMTTDAKNRMDASFLANNLIARMWVDQANLAAYTGTDVPVGELPNGQRTVKINGDEVTITYSWRLPGASETHSVSVVTRITGGV